VSRVPVYIAETCNEVVMHPSLLFCQLATRNSSEVDGNVDVRCEINGPYKLQQVQSI